MEAKFSRVEVGALRQRLVEHGLDSLQTAEMIRMFIAGHGYGVSRETALDTACRIESPGYNLERLHQELETLAMVM
ncbi:MAG TPA: hypothetical protein VKY85_25815 [Candidatus Angelobacter sp.]|jgi:DNA repair protein RadC|nr:hypothetical protein [Candidatus Angelobacter sp.]